MKKRTVVQRIDAVLPQDGILLWGLRFLVTTLEPFTLNALLKKYIRRHAVVNIPNEKPKTPRWVSEFWTILCLILAILGLHLAEPLQQMPFGVTQIGMALLCLVWPFLRLAELVLFVIGWIFVYDDMLHSIQRSLLSFLINLFEVSLLLTTLSISLSPSLLLDRWSEVYQTFFLMLTLSPPDPATHGSVYSLQVFRFWFGLVVVLCIIGSLAGGIIRRTVPRAGE